MRKLISSVLPVLILAIMLAVGCAKPAPPSVPASAPGPPETLYIGIATPLTGPLAFLGTHIKNAILMAIANQNDHGGVTIGGQKYVLNAIVRDTKQDVVLAKSIAEELVYDKGVKVIAGPFIADAVGMQFVTEPNKVIFFGTQPAIPQMIGPEKPYTFFSGRPMLQMFNNPCAYVQKFYPGEKTVISLMTDLADLSDFENSIKTMCARYGLNWLGYEKAPLDTRDFMSMISRALSRNPDIVETSNTGALGAPGALLVKQVREAGFNGIIMIPAIPPPGLLEEVVPREYMRKIVTNDLNPDGPVITQAYRDICKRYEMEFALAPADIVAWVYNILGAFFNFLDNQDTMDTTVWMKGFEKYHWQGPFGVECYWVGKKIWGINRMVLGPPWVSEIKDGKLVTDWAAPIPYDLFVQE